MELDKVLESGTPQPTTDLGKAARAFVSAAAVFVGELARNNIDLDFGEAEDTSNTIDYDAPVSDSYKKTYKPISASEIVQANKDMSEALAGEKYVEGFLACIKLMTMVK